MFDSVPASQSPHPAARDSFVAMASSLQPASRLDARMSGPAVQVGSGEEIYAEGDRAGDCYCQIFGHGMFLFMRVTSSYAGMIEEWLWSGPPN